jgi:hypothetical protein
MEHAGERGHIRLDPVRRAKHGSEERGVVGDPVLDEFVVRCDSPQHQIDDGVGHRWQLPRHPNSDAFEGLPHLIAAASKNTLEKLVTGIVPRESLKRPRQRIGIPVSKLEQGLHDKRQERPDLVSRERIAFSIPAEELPC